MEDATTKATHTDVPWDYDNNEAPHRQQEPPGPTICKDEPEPPKPVKRRKRKPTKPKKNAVKQRAGRLGCRARWRKDLGWHREWVQEELPQGWCLALRHALMRAVLIHHVEPECEYWDAKTYHWRWNPEARTTWAELLPLARAAHVTVDTLQSLMRAVPGPDLRAAKECHWSREHIVLFLGAPPFWMTKLLSISAQGSGSRRAERILRRRTALLQIVGRMIPRWPSIREARLLLAEAGFQSSYFTVRTDLEQTRKMLPGRRLVSAV